MAEKRRKNEIERNPGSRVSTRKLALAAGVTCLAAQFLSHVGSGLGDGNNGPLNVVIGQALWNAAQVGLLLLLLCLWRVDRRASVIALSVATLACLPFAIYVNSPAGAALSVILLATCALTKVWSSPHLSIAIIDAPSRSKPVLLKLEMLAFVCNLFCSMYNFAGSGLWPHWSRIYADIGQFIGFTPNLTSLARDMYTLQLDGVRLPPYVVPGTPVSGFGALVFLLIWTVVPTLYVLYFAALAKLARNSPGTRLQQALCFLCIFHFLFLTDLVDYRFGRGIQNQAAILCHWVEVFAWRIAILLPIYQKLIAGDWRRGNGMVGVLLHYTVAGWAAFFLIYEVVLHDALRFYKYTTGDEFTPVKLFGIGRPEVLGFHGAYLLMTLLFGFMLIAMCCKRITATASASEVQPA